MEDTLVLILMYLLVILALVDVKLDYMLRSMYRKNGQRTNLPVFLTGKGKRMGWISLMRPEATGFGTVYFAEEMLKTKR
jgi:glutamate dehydrogenase/leucine dehydrogenase